MGACVRAQGKINIKPEPEENLTEKPPFPLPIEEFQLPTISFSLPTTHFSLPTTSFPLPTAVFSLPTEQFQLPTTSFPLPTAEFSLEITDISLEKGFSGRGGGNSERGCEVYRGICCRVGGGLRTVVRRLVRRALFPGRRLRARAGRRCPVGRGGGP